VIFVVIGCVPDQSYLTIRWTSVSTWSATWLSYIQQHR